MTEPNSAFEADVDSLIARAFDMGLNLETLDRVKEVAKRVLDAYAGVVAERDAAFAERDFWVESATSNAGRLAAAKAEIERLNAEADKRNAQIFDLHAEVERQQKAIKRAGFNLL